MIGKSIYEMIRDNTKSPESTLLICRLIDSVYRDGVEAGRIGAMYIAPFELYSDDTILEGKI